MRKILSREAKNRKVKRNYLIMGIILIAILIFSGFGYAFNNRDTPDIDKIEYNGIEFVRDASGYWVFEIQGSNFATRYNPEETSDIVFFSYLSIENYANKPLYFSGEFNDPKSELYRNLNPFVLRLNEACLSEDCEGNFPLKNCSSDNIIIFKESINESEGILQEENCVYITANIANQTRYADAFLFKLLGI